MDWGTFLSIFAQGVLALGLLIILACVASVIIDAHRKPSNVDLHSAIRFHGRAFRVTSLSYDRGYGREDFITLRCEPEGQYQLRNKAEDA